MAKRIGFAGVPSNDEMITITDRLPTREECLRVRQLRIQASTLAITDDELATILSACLHLETAILSGVPDLTDRTVGILAENAHNLQSINLTGCNKITDVGVLQLISKSLPLRSICLSGVSALTDLAICAIAKTCSRLVELELCDLPLVTSTSIRDVWSYSRKLRTLRLARCHLITDKAFPAVKSEHRDQPLPSRPPSWPGRFPPLILTQYTESLRVLDLTFCEISDDAIGGIVAHAPRIHTLILAHCTALTDRSLENISGLGMRLTVLVLAHVSNMSDHALVKTIRACPNLRSVDVAFCRGITDMSIFELAALNNLRQLDLTRVQKVTDIGIFSLAEQAFTLERVYLSYCDRITLEAIHRLAKGCVRLRYLSAIGVPACRRIGLRRFSDAPPPSHDGNQQAHYTVFSGENIEKLSRFLDKEGQRKREAEAKNILYEPRSDDVLDLY